MKLKILIVFILLNILIPIKSSAEILSNAVFENISIDDGLSNEHITSIFQDSKGYIWIGTKDGLNRYDGEFVKIYNCNDEDEYRLSSTYIIDIEEDFNGNIWIATDSGLDILLVDTGTVIRMKDYEDEDNYNLGKLKITALLNSRYEESIMWVGTENGLVKINIENKTIETFYHNPNDSDSLSNSSITCLEEDDNNLLWIGTKEGINIVDKNMKINKNMIDDDKLYINHMSKDNFGDIWISTKQGVYIYKTSEDNKNDLFLIDSAGVKNINEKDVVDVHTFEDEEIKFYNNFIFCDSKNNIWLSSSDGVIKYTKDKKEFDILKQDTTSKCSISSDVITCFYEDSNGTMWIGTDKGANILNNNTVFNYINSKENKNIVSILRHNDYIWVATKFNGIYIYDAKDGDLVKELDDDENFNLNDRYIRNLFSINDTYVVAVTNKELIYFNTYDYTYEEFLVNDGYVSEIDYIYSDGKDIWIASTTDFYRYNIETKEKTYYSEDIESMGINPGRIKYMLPDNNDEDIIWICGVETGLIRYHKQKGILKIYVNNSSEENSLINNYINCLTFDNEGNLWIGTNIGISKFNIDTEEFTSYTTADGLSNNFINSILIDDNNDIWISTNKGLNKFDIEKDNFMRFTKIDGLYGYQFNLNSSLKLKNGFMIFGSTDGCIYFNPDDLSDYKIVTNEVVIGDIYIGKDKVTYDGNELVLAYDYGNIYINYFLPNYKSLNNVTYEYMLEGIDEDWIYADSRNSLEFKSLEAGKYTLKLRARDGHGELTKETSINIRVKNPIWKTPLAYLIYISIILVLSIYVFNYVKILHHLVDQKTMKLNKQLEENKRLSKEIIDNEKFKNNYFVNLSHELRTPINVIVSTVQLINLTNKNKNIPYEKLSEYMNIIGKNCDNLLKIINDIIDSSKIETGKYKINKKNNDIVYIVEEAALNMSKFIEEKGLSLIIDPDMEEKIISCDATEIERCIINLLGNAVKFTDEGGEIRIYIKEVEDNIEITVEDTGIGISKEDQEFIFKRFSQVDGASAIKASSSGIGLTLVKYIVELHGGYVRLESEINKGSKFTIGIPNIAEKEFNN